MYAMSGAPLSLEVIALCEGVRVRVVSSLLACSFSLSQA